jgi:hypothetical protein
MSQNKGKKLAARTKRTDSTRARADDGWRASPIQRDAKERLEKCLGLLRIHGVINVACRQSQIAGRSLSKSTFYEVRRDYPDFDKEVQEAIEQSVEELEADGMACARLARKDPRYLPMLKFMLQAKAGLSTKERVEHVGAGGGPIQVGTHELTEEEAAEAYRKALSE